MFTSFFLQKQTLFLNQLGDITCVSFSQNVADLSDLISSGRDRKPEEIAFEEECQRTSLAFRAERFNALTLLYFLGRLLLSCGLPLQFTCLSSLVRVMLL